MKVLMISTDRKIWDTTSAVHARMQSYAQFFDELHIVVFAKKNLGLTKEIYGEKLHVYPTQSRTKIGYIFDAIKLGKHILSVSSKNYQLATKDWAISTQDPFETGIVGARLSRKNAIPLHVQIHTDFLSPHFKRGGVLNIVRRLIGEYLVLLTDRIRVVSARIQHGLVARLHIPTEKIDVLPIQILAVDSVRDTRSGLLQKQFPQFDHIALVASRLEREKNIGWIIDSWKTVRAQFPKAGLVIVGEGSLGEKLHKQVERCGLSDAVVFLPWQRDLTPYYASADVFVSVSWYEGYGMTLMEAARAHCPIISTRVGVVGYELSDELVTVVDSKDQSSLGSAISLVFASPVPFQKNADLLSQEIALQIANVDRYPNAFCCSVTNTSRASYTPHTVVSMLGTLFHTDSLFALGTRYIISGGTAAIVDLGTLYVLTDLFAVWYVLSAAIAFAVAFGVSFLMQKFWTFRDHDTDRVHTQVLLYLVISVANLLLNTAMVYGFVEYLRVHYLLAQIVTSGLIACESFLVYKLLIFVRR